MELFSNRIRQLRKETGKKQEEIGADLNFSRGMVSQYEHGREPDYATLISLARYFDVSTDYLLGLSQDRKPAGDDLTAAVDLAASSAVSAGAPAVSASDLTRVASLMADYLAHDPTAGAEPARLASALMSAMEALLGALQSGSTAQVLDATDAMLTSVLDVNGVMGAFLQRKEA